MFTSDVVVVHDDINNQTAAVGAGATADRSTATDVMLMIARKKLKAHKSSVLVRIIVTATLAFA